MFSPIGKVGLAPMAGAGDSGFRRICKEWGADYTVSEMISAKAVQHGSEKTVLLARHRAEEEPFIIQLFGRDPLAIHDAAAILWKQAHPAGIDLNMGCPAPKIFKNGEGSALLREPELAAQLVRAALEGCGCPVSVKMRIGISSIDEKIADFARRLEQAGAAMITVHGRTREQFYAGEVALEPICMIKAALRIPVIANGDMADGASVQRVLKKTGADGVMLARGALGAPYVFMQIKQALQGNPVSIVSLEKRFEICLNQLRYTIEDKGEPHACIEFRKHLLWYLKGIAGAARFKDQASRLTCYSECEDLLRQVLQSRE